MHQQQTAFENIVGREEIAHKEQFLLFPQCFLLNQKIVLPFVNIFDIMFLFAAEMEEPEIGISGKQLTDLRQHNNQEFWELQFVSFVFWFYSYSNKVDKS